MRYVFSDINECEHDPCDPNAACRNMPGSYTCSCDFGYQGDGFQCEGKTRDKYYQNKIIKKYILYWPQV